MNKLFYWIGSLYIKSPLPLYINVLITLFAIILLICWLI